MASTSAIRCLLLAMLMTVPISDDVELTSEKAADEFTSEAVSCRSFSCSCSLSLSLSGLLLLSMSDSRADELGDVDADNDPLLLIMRASSAELIPCRSLLRRSSRSSSVSDIGLTF